MIHVQVLNKTSVKIFENKINVYEHYNTFLEEMATHCENLNVNKIKRAKSAF